MSAPTPVSTILFGSIGTLADTSELQREAFNSAFAEHGLDWQWDRADYIEMLRTSGGQARVTEQARRRGVEVDAAAVHATKSAHFQARLADGVTPRAGVLTSVGAARKRGQRLALITTTSAANVAALLTGIGPELGADTFDLVLDADQVPASKPDPAAYLQALDQLGVSAADALAVEDNVGGLAAAVAAGVRCVAFPNANTTTHDFTGAERVVYELDPAKLI